MANDTKKKLFLLSFLALAGLVIPLHFAHAFIAELASNIFFGIFAVGLWIVANIAMVAVGIVAGLLDWAMSPGGFIFLPYTSGGIVDIGWAITRDLTNIGFVLGLVVIGLATALRYGDYQAKKALPKLILMALLVNFTPVIVGLLVDAGNIIMKFFLTETVGWDAWLRLMQGLWGGGDSLGLQTIFDFFTKPISMVLLAKSMAVIMFSFITASFLFLYFLLFLMRYVAIWLLVIVSPLAFFSWIFPATKSYFSQWWDQFLQWNFIGVSAAFVLYLSQQLFAMVLTMPIVSPPTSDPLGIANVLSNILPYSVVNAFMLIGFMGAMSSSAMGANGVMSVTKNIVSGTGKAIASRAGQTAKNWGGNQWNKIATSGKFQGFATRLTNLKNVGANMPGTKGRLVRAGAGALGLNVAAGLGRSAGAGMQNAYQNSKNKIDAQELECKKMTVDQTIVKGKNAQAAGDLETEIGVLNHHIKNGSLDDYRKGLIQSGMTEAEIDKWFGSILQRAESRLGKIDGHKEILAANPHLKEAGDIIRKQATPQVLAAAAIHRGGVAGSLTASDIAGVTEADMAAVTAADMTAADNASDLAISERDMKPKHVTSMSAPVVTANAQVSGHFEGKYNSLFKKMKPERAAQIPLGIIVPGTPSYDPAIAKRAFTNWDGRHAAKIIDSYGPDAIKKAINGLAAAAGTNAKAWLTTNNSSLLRYIDSNAGKQFFAFDTNAANLDNLI